MKNKKQTSLKNYKSRWRVLVLTNKGQFLSPQTFNTKKLAEEFIEKLKKTIKKYH